LDVAGVLPRTMREQLRVERVFRDADGAAARHASPSGDEAREW
jgi:hypothetical protein